MKNKEISFEEKRCIQMGMLKEIDAFCRSNNIRYSLSSGTLIGAVRHKGFIPWDDDLDITMPLPDMIRFKNKFISKTIKFCDIDTENHYLYSFPRLSYLPSYSIQNGRISSGVCIDLYVVVGIPEDINEQKKYFDTAIKLYNKRKNFIIWRNRLARYLPIESLPGMDKCIRKYRDHLYSFGKPYEKCTVFYRIASPQTPKLIKKNTLYFDFFDKLIEIQFENLMCLCTNHYDDYLSQRYGDYMQLPPLEQQHPTHGGKSYWK